MENQKRRCYGCMEELDGAVCLHCGYDNNEKNPDFALPAGTLLHKGKYLVGRMLGQGGFGITYIGLDRALQLKVAIKEYYPVSLAGRATDSGALVWHSAAGGGESGRESFVREARKMAKTDMIPGVVMVRDIFYENNTAYIVMGYIEGETLRARLETTGRLNAAGCLGILRPVMEALGEAHRRGLVHRDVSPDNIMLDRMGKVWLLDLGAAKELDAGNASIAQSSQLVIKKGFSPPEQYMNGGSIGPWTDVYAMCATAYYCMTGKLVPEAVERTMGTPVTYPPEIPAAVAAVLARGLALRPEQRLQSMEALLAALEAALASPAPEEIPSPPYIPPPVSPPREAVRKPGTERKLPKAGFLSVAIALAAVAVIAAVLLLPGRESAPVATLAPTAAPAQAAAQETAPAPVATERPVTANTPTPTFVPELTPAPTPTATPIPTPPPTPTPEATPTPTPIPVSRSGTCGKNLTWALDEDGTLVISGDGEMENYSPVRGSRETTAPWNGIKSEITSVIIREGVTSIGKDAFLYCINLMNITFSESVTNFGVSSFAECTRLTSVAIPTGVTYLFGTFSSCTSLKSVTIPDSVTNVDWATFSNCTSLTDVYYSGTKAQWDAITIGNGNDALKSATIHYNGEYPAE